MSKNETPLTLAYWEKVKGTLIEDIPNLRIQVINRDTLEFE